MQVHKEAIDKVPNSVPNRSNIEIEIYGMEGIPPQDIRDHEKQKNGNKSESDDDEPSVKKPKMDQMQLQQQQIQQPTQLPPQMVMQSLVSPFQMAPMLGQIPGMSPYMPVQMLNPHHMMGQRPLFPSAIATSAIASQPKPTFPAYSNATISAPPTTNLGSSVAANNSTTTNTEPPQKQPVLQTSGASSKILHPPEDTSLEEIRARKPQYKTNKSMHNQVSSPQSSASSTPTSVASSQKYNETKMVAAAHEVCSDLF